MHMHSPEMTFKHGKIVIWSGIHCTKFVSMNIENMSLLQVWPVLCALVCPEVRESQGKFASKSQGIL